MRAEQTQLEDIAKPLTVEDAEGGGSVTGEQPDEADESRAGRAEVLNARRDAQETQARAADERAIGDEEQARALSAADDDEAAHHQELADAERERERRQHDFEQRVRARIARRQIREREGFRRFRPGPPTRVVPPWMVSSPADDADDLDREIAAISQALDEHGATDRHELARLVGARYWGPGRFRLALGEAVEEGYARRLSRSTFGPPDDDPA